VVERNLGCAGGDPAISFHDISSVMRSAASETEGRKVDRPEDLILGSTGLVDRVEDVAELV